VGVVEEAAVDLAVEVHGGLLGHLVGHAAPAPVLLPDGVGPFEDVGDPADLTLRIGQLQGGETDEDAGEEEVDHGEGGVRVDQGGTDRRRGVLGGGGHLGRGSDVHVHDGLGLGAGGEEGVPVVVRIVHGGQAQKRWDLAEADGADTALGVAADLGGGHVGIPEGDERQGDEPSVGRRAPLLDHPVVVGPDAEQGELLVLGLVEGLSAEAGEGGEAERGLEVVGVHVLEPGLHLKGARSHVLVGDPFHGDLVARDPDGRVDAQERATEFLVVPPVGGRALGAGGHGELAADVGDLAHRCPDDSGADVLVLRREAVHPDIGRLDDVVIDRDDHG